MEALSRRGFLRGLGALAVVVGWSSRDNRWVTAAEAASCSFEELPELDGVLLKDPASRLLAADDYGHVIRHEPCAVLRPGSVDDVVKMVRYSAARGIPVSMRGNGHSSYGQSQVAAGVVIDSATLARIHRIEDDRAVVDAGVLWRTLLVATAARNLTPPVLADYQDLTVGGTLSLGGFDSGPMPHGAQVDNLLELEVVTGDGELTTCSPTRNTDLFDAVAAGLGQCAIIVRATIRLVPAPGGVLLVRLRYTDIETNLRDQAMLIRTRRFDAFEELVSWEDGRWVYDLQGAVYFTPPHVPDVGSLFDGLHDDPLRRTVAPIPYLAWAFRLDPLVAATKALGPRTRYVLSNGIVPEEAGPGFLGDLFRSKTSDDLGGGRAFLLAVNTSALHRPLLRVPASEVAFAVLLLRVDRDGARLNEFLSDARTFYDDLVAVGGTRYPWDAVPDVTAEDWATHYGPQWDMFRDAKARYDPANILGSGVGIFH